MGRLIRSTLPAGVLGGLAAALVIVGIGSGPHTTRGVLAIPAHPIGRPSSIFPTSGVRSARQIYAQAAPSVVAIRTGATGTGPFGGGATQSGSSFVVGPNGLIVPTTT